MKFSKKASGERGAIMIMTALLLTVLISFSALTIDIGLHLYLGAKLQNAVDSAATAVASNLDANVDTLDDIAYQYLAKNGYDRTKKRFNKVEVKVEQKSYVDENLLMTDAYEDEDYISSGFYKVTVKVEDSTLFGNFFDIDALHLEKVSYVRAEADYEQVPEALKFSIFAGSTDGTDDVPAMDLQGMSGNFTSSVMGATEIGINFVNEKLVQPIIGWFGGSTDMNSLVNINLSEIVMNGDAHSNSNIMIGVQALNVSRMKDTDYEGADIYNSDQDGVKVDNSEANALAEDETENEYDDYGAVHFDAVETIDFGYSQKVKQAQAAAEKIEASGNFISRFVNTVRAWPSQYLANNPDLARVYVQNRQRTEETQAALNVLNTMNLGAITDEGTLKSQYTQAANVYIEENGITDSERANLIRNQVGNLSYVPGGSGTEDDKISLANQLSIVYRVNQKQAKEYLNEFVKIGIDSLTSQVNSVGYDTATDGNSNHEPTTFAHKADTSESFVYGILFSREDDTSNYTKTAEVTGTKINRNITKTEATRTAAGYDGAYADKALWGAKYSVARTFKQYSSYIAMPNMKPYFTRAINQSVRNATKDKYDMTDGTVTGARTVKEAVARAQAELNQTIEDAEKEMDETVNDHDDDSVFTDDKYITYGEDGAADTSKLTAYDTTPLFKEFKESSSSGLTALTNEVQELGGARISSTSYQGYNLYKTVNGTKTLKTANDHIDDFAAAHITKDDKGEADYGEGAINKFYNSIKNEKENAVDKKKTELLARDYYNNKKNSVGNELNKYTMPTASVGETISGTITKNSAFNGVAFPTGDIFLGDGNNGKTGDKKLTVGTNSIRNSFNTAIGEIENESAVESATIPGTADDDLPVEFNNVSVSIPSVPDEYALPSDIPADVPSRTSVNDTPTSNPGITQKGSEPGTGSTGTATMADHNWFNLKSGYKRSLRITQGQYIMFNNECYISSGGKSLDLDPGSTLYANSNIRIEGNNTWDGWGGHIDFGDAPSNGVNQGVTLYCDGYVNIKDYDQNQTETIYEGSTVHIGGDFTLTNRIEVRPQCEVNIGGKLEANYITIDGGTTGTNVYISGDLNAKQYLSIKGKANVIIKGKINLSDGKTADISDEAKVYVIGSSAITGGGGATLNINNTAILYSKSGVNFSYINVNQNGDAQQGGKLYSEGAIAAGRNLTCSSYSFTRGTDISTTTYDNNSFTNYGTVYATSSFSYTKNNNYTSDLYNHGTIYSGGTISSWRYLQNESDGKMIAVNSITSGNNDSNNGIGNAGEMTAKTISTTGHINNSNKLNATQKLHTDRTLTNTGNIKVNKVSENDATAIEVSGTIANNSGGVIRAIGNISASAITNNNTAGNGSGADIFCGATISAGAITNYYNNARIYANSISATGQVTNNNGCTISTITSLSASGQTIENSGRIISKGTISADTIRNFSVYTDSSKGGIRAKGIITASTSLVNGSENNENLLIASATGISAGGVTNYGRIMSGGGFEFTGTVSSNQETSTLVCNGSVTGTGTITCTDLTAKASIVCDSLSVNGTVKTNGNITVSGATTIASNKKIVSVNGSVSTSNLTVKTGAKLLTKGNLTCYGYVTNNGTIKVGSLSDTSTFSIRGISDYKSLINAGDICVTGNVSANGKLAFTGGSMYVLGNVDASNGGSSEWDRRDVLDITGNTTIYVRGMVFSTNHTNACVYLHGDGTATLSVLGNGSTDNQDCFKNSLREFANKMPGATVYLGTGFNHCSDSTRPFYNFGTLYAYGAIVAPTASDAFLGADTSSDSASGLTYCRGAFNVTAANVYTYGSHILYVEADTGENNTGILTATRLELAHTSKVYVADKCYINGNIVLHNTTLLNVINGGTAQGIELDTGSVVDANISVEINENSSALSGTQTTFTGNLSRSGNLSLGNGSVVIIEKQTGSVNSGNLTVSGKLTVRNSILLVKGNVTCNELEVDNGCLAVVGDLDCATKITAKNGCNLTRGGACITKYSDGTYYPNVYVGGDVKTCNTVNINENTNTKSVVFVKGDMKASSVSATLGEKAKLYVKGKLNLAGAAPGANAAVVGYDELNINGTVTGASGSLVFCGEDSSLSNISSVNDMHGEFYFPEKNGTMTLTNLQAYSDSKVVIGSKVTISSWAEVASGGMYYCSDVTKLDGCIFTNGGEMYLVGGVDMSSASVTEYDFYKNDGYGLKTSTPDFKLLDASVSYIGQPYNGSTKLDDLTYAGNYEGRGDVYIEANLVVNGHVRYEGTDLAGNKIKVGNRATSIYIPWGTTYVKGDVTIADLCDNKNGNSNDSNRRNNGLLINSNCGLVMDGDLNMASCIYNFGDLLMFGKLNLNNTAIAITDRDVKDGKTKWDRNYNGYSLRNGENEADMNSGNGCGATFFMYNHGTKGDPLTFIGYVRNSGDIYVNAPLDVRGYVDSGGEENFAFLNYYNAKVFVNGDVRLNNKMIYNKKNAVFSCSGDITFGRCIVNVGEFVVGGDATNDESECSRTSGNSDAEPKVYNYDSGTSIRTSDVYQFDHISLFNGVNYLESETGHDDFYNTFAQDNSPYSSTKALFYCGGTVKLGTTEIVDTKKAAGSVVSLGTMHIKGSLIDYTNAPFASFSNYASVNALMKNDQSCSYFRTALWLYNGSKTFVGGNTFAAAAAAVGQNTIFMCDGDYISKRATKINIRMYYDRDTIGVNIFGNEIAWVVHNLTYDHPADGEEYHSAFFYVGKNAYFNTLGSTSQSFTGGFVAPNNQSRDMDIYANTNMYVGGAMYANSKVYVKENCNILVGGNGIMVDQDNKILQTIQWGTETVNGLWEEHYENGTKKGTPEKQTNRNRMKKDIEDNPDTKFYVYQCLDVSPHSSVVVGGGTLVRNTAKIRDMTKTYVYGNFRCYDYVELGKAMDDSNDTKATTNDFKISVAGSSTDAAWRYKYTDKSSTDLKADNANVGVYRFARAPYMYVKGNYTSGQTAMEWYQNNSFDLFDSSTWETAFSRFRGYTRVFASSTMRVGGNFISNRFIDLKHHAKVYAGGHVLASTNIAGKDFSWLYSGGNVIAGWVYTDATNNSGILGTIINAPSQLIKATQAYIDFGDESHFYASGNVESVRHIGFGRHNTVRVGGNMTTTLTYIFANSYTDMFVGGNLRATTTIELRGGEQFVDNRDGHIITDNDEKLEAKKKYNAAIKAKETPEVDIYKSTYTILGNMKSILKIHIGEKKSSEVDYVIPLISEVNGGTVTGGGTVADNSGGDNLGNNEYNDGDKGYKDEQDKADDGSTDTTTEGGSGATGDDSGDNITVDGSGNMTTDADSETVDPTNDLATDDTDISDGTDVYVGGQMISYLAHIKEFAYTRIFVGDYVFVLNYVTLRHNADLWVIPESFGNQTYLHQDYVHQDGWESNWWTKLGDAVAQLGYNIADALSPKSGSVYAISSLTLNKNASLFGTYDATVVGKCILRRDSMIYVGHDFNCTAPAGDISWRSITGESSYTGFDSCSTETKTENTYRFVCTNKSAHGGNYYRMDMDSSYYDPGKTYKCDKCGATITAEPTHIYKPHPAVVFANNEMNITTTVSMKMTYLITNRGNLNLLNLYSQGDNLEGNAKDLPNALCSYQKNIDYFANYGKLGALFYAPAGNIDLDGWYSEIWGSIMGNTINMDSYYLNVHRFENWRTLDLHIAKAGNIYLIPQKEYEDAESNVDDIYMYGYDKNPNTNLVDWAQPFFASEGYEYDYENSTFVETEENVPQD